MPTESKSETPRTFAVLGTPHQLTRLIEESTKIEKELNEANAQLEKYLLPLKDYCVKAGPMGSVEYTKYGEFILGLPMNSLCVCGCEKQCHGHLMGVVGFGQCSNRKHLCSEFAPNKGILSEFWSQFIDALTQQNSSLKQERNTLAKELAEAKQMASLSHQRMMLLAKENKVMREALEYTKSFLIAAFITRDRKDLEVIDGPEVISEIEKALTQCNTTNLIVLTRNELIAEIEKMPCICSPSLGFGSLNPHICGRCKWLARVKGQ